jgi:hypothetical protein
MFLGILVMLIGVILLVQVYLGNRKANFGRADISGPIVVAVIVFGIILLAL